jgi:ABC-type multidrug transport system ATPase subunit
VERRDRVQLLYLIVMFAQWPIVLLLSWDYSRDYQGNDWKLNFFNEYFFGFFDSPLTIEQCYYLAFFLITDTVSSICGVKAEELIITGFSNRVTHYLISNGGSKFRYVLACYISDFLERIVIYSITIPMAKVFITGSISLGWREVFMLLIFSVYDMVRQFLVSLIPTHMAQSFKHYLICKFLFTKTILFAYGLVAVKTLSLGAGPRFPKSQLSLVWVGFYIYVQAMRHAPEGQDDGAWQKIVGPVEGDMQWLAWLLLWFIIYATILGFIVWWNWRIKQCLVRLTFEHNRSFTAVGGAVKASTEEIEIEDQLASDESSDAKIKVRNLRKVFDNGFVAVDGVSFAVEKGKTMGILGPGGCGKSALIETVGGILQRTSGEVYIEGEKMNNYSNKRLSFALQKNVLWETLTPREHLEIFGQWRGISIHAIEHLIKELDRVFHFEQDWDTRVIKLSSERQKQIGLALALFGRPKVLLLDEATVGMGEKSLDYFWKVLQTYQEESECSILFTTHAIQEAEIYADKVAIMVNGKLQRIGSLERIVYKGFSLTIVATTEVSNWSSISSILLGSLTGSRLVRDNGRNKLTIQVPRSTEADSISDLIAFSKNKIKELGATGLTVTATWPDLLETYHSYALDQEVNTLPDDNVSRSATSEPKKNSVKHG